MYLQLCLGFVGILVFNCRVVLSSGTLEVQMISFHNPDHTLESFACCNQDTVVCRHKCRNLFTICVLHSNRCGYGSPITSNIMDDDEISFNDRFFENSSTTIENPWKTKFDKWEGAISVRISVEAQVVPTTAIEPVATFEKEFKIDYKDFGVELNHWENVLDKIINFSVKIYCDKQFLKPDCTNRCIPRDDERGHYYCTDYGLVCLPGWQDVNKNCTVCNSTSCLSSDVYLSPSSLMGRLTSLTTSNLMGRLTSLTTSNLMGRLTSLTTSNLMGRLTSLTSSSFNTIDTISKHKTLFITMTSRKDTLKSICATASSSVKAKYTSLGASGSGTILFSISKHSPISKSLKSIPLTQFLSVSSVSTLSSTFNKTRRTISNSNLKHFSMGDSTIATSLVVLSSIPSVSTMSPSVDTSGTVLNSNTKDSSVMENTVTRRLAPSQTSLMVSSSLSLNVTTTTNERHTKTSLTWLFAVLAASVVALVFVLLLYRSKGETSCQQRKPYSDVNEIVQYVEMKSTNSCKQAKQENLKMSCPPFAE